MKYIGKLEYDKNLNEDGIIIFGAGKGLNKLLNKLERAGVKDRVICICDNAHEKQGQELAGIRIYSLKYTFEHYKNASYIVYNRFCVEICRQLVNSGITNIHLIID